MAKSITSFVCQECGYDSPAFLGKCPECGAWNSFKEFREPKGNGSRLKPGMTSRGSMTSLVNEKPQPLSTISQNPKERLTTGFLEMDNVLGGGIVLGSATLVAGDPGIGKSTLLLQLCLNLAKRGQSVLYVSAEESREQVAMRAQRVRQEIPNSKSQTPKTVISNSLEKNEKPHKEDLSVSPRDDNNKLYSESKPEITGEENLLLLSMTNTDMIARTIEETKPDLVVIDSVQTVESENAGGLSGSVGQVRYASSTFIRSAKQNNIPIMLVGHVTKEGMVAGPMVLSHMVDTVLFLEGEKFTKTRILRSLKNRFGPVDEVGVFIMEGIGMSEVLNPEQIFLSTKQQHIPGTVMVVIMEGTRPFLIEIQALAVYSKYPMPKRVASGMDQKRLELLLAVLQKHARLPVETHDIFVNIAGGIKVTDPAVDLGVCLAVYSSLKNKPLDNTVGISEVGLLGELRKVPYVEKRIKEAKKLGFKNIVTAESFETLTDVLRSFGFAENSKTWKQADERHFKLEEE